MVPVTEKTRNGLVAEKVTDLVLVKVVEPQTTVLLSNAIDLHQIHGQQKEEMIVEMFGETMLIPMCHQQALEFEAGLLLEGIADARAVRSTEVEMITMHLQDDFHHEELNAQGPHQGADRDHPTIAVSEVHLQSEPAITPLDARRPNERGLHHQIVGMTDHVRLHGDHTHRQEILEEEATDLDRGVHRAEAHTQMTIGGEDHRHLEHQDQNLPPLQDGLHHQFIQIELA